MNVRSLFRTRLNFLLLVLLLLESLHGVAASHGSSSNSPSGFLLESRPLFSDFDGDNRIDQATLSSSGRHKNIHVALGSSSWSLLSFDSSDGDRGRIVSGDIDADGDIDLVWISQSGRKFVAWLGDGRGNFSIGTDPNFNADRLQALLGDGSPSVAAGPNGAEFAAVLLSTIFIAPRINGYQPYFSTQDPLPAIDRAQVAASYLPVLKQRGPPAGLSDDQS